MADCVNALKKWTGKARATVIYDSTVDEFTHDGLFQKVKGKPNIAIVGFTTDGDVFGAFYGDPVTEQDHNFKELDLFLFSFESHGRCETPQRFVVKEGWRGRTWVNFSKSSYIGFVEFWVGGGGGSLRLGNENSS